MLGHGRMPSGSTWLLLYEAAWGVQNMNSSLVAVAIRLGCVAVLVSVATGCATVVKGSHQGVPVSSDPPGADVLVDGNLVGQTPLKVEMKRKHDHLVTIQKTGYRPKSVAVVKDVGGAVWGNIIAGGLIGWGVDASTGAQYNLTPRTISVSLESDTTVAARSTQEDPGVFVSKLKALDLLKEGKQISDEEYGKARLALFRQYMPEALPPDASATPPANAVAAPEP